MQTEERRLFAASLFIFRRPHQMQCVTLIWNCGRHLSIIFDQLLKKIHELAVTYALTHLGISPN
jgi:hypothetical protein